MKSGNEMFRFQKHKCNISHLSLEQYKTYKKKQLYKLLPFVCFMDYLKLNFVQPLNQLASGPDGAIPPIKSTFVINGRAFKIGSSK
ncbi:MAG: hypothetical protein JWP81_3117 [Ferruginibacter sp.]|nr:hypothetical protein [Ferruginibacter sp.]